MADPKFKLTFGKYKDWTIHTVYSADPSYCRWLVKKDTLLSPDSEIKKYLLEKFEGDNDNSYLMTFGKHKGKSLNWVHEHDSSYFDWLTRNSYVQENMPKLKEAIAALTN